MGPRPIKYVSYFHNQFTQFKQNNVGLAKKKFSISNLAITSSKTRRATAPSNHASTSHPHSTGTAILAPSTLISRSRSFSLCSVTSSSLRQCNYKKIIDHWLLKITHTTNYNTKSYNTILCHVCLYTIISFCVLGLVLWLILYSEANLLVQQPLYFSEH